MYIHQDGKEVEKVSEPRRLNGNTIEGVIRRSCPVHTPSPLLYKTVMDGGNNRLCGALEALLSREKDAYR